MSLDLLSEVVSSLGALVLERTGAGTFLTLGPVPPWAASALGEQETGGPGSPFDVAAFSPFLENFLVEAQAADGHAVEERAEPLERLSVAIDDDDVVALDGEQRGQLRTDPSAPDDGDVHPSVAPPFAARPLAALTTGR